MNTLIVDDHEENRYLLEILFKGNGHGVRVASNGAEAFEILQTPGIDLIVSDILMPVMDGFQLCRKVKTDETLRAIPLIIYTATYTGPQDEAFALKIGADRFIQKPCEPEAFMAAVNEVIVASRRRGGVLSTPPVEEEEALKLYSERLVRKLEEKMLQAEREIAARQEAEQSLRESEARLIAAQRLARMGDFVWDVETGEVTWSDALFDLLGYDKSATVDYAQFDAKIYHPEDRAHVTRWFDDAIASGTDELPPNEYRVIRQDGQILFVHTVGNIRRRPGKKPIIFATVQDITERRLAEDERERLHAQLLQAQKLESIGRLAGGVAHDFNNMLSVILGRADMLLGDLPGDSALRSDLEEIRKAAERSVELTRQLLAFARKQTIAPQILDLNATVASMLKILERLIGEDIELIWRPAQTLEPVHIDPAQIDQLLANLCVNARDAIGHEVGKVTIETGQAEFDDDYCVSNPGFLPGRYVMLAVSDNGCGMDEATQANIFEPFFTTKGVGKGTGLGLATVFGIVKQNHGFINVYSEVGQGTVFRIYLPAHQAGKARRASSPTVAAPVARGGETILLVEDEPSILDMARTMLECLGYTVLAASTPGAAIRMAEHNPGEIHLLITDVVMPEMNGRDLARNVQVLYPNLKRLFMSGYTANVIAHQGVLDAGVNFIQKPFSRQDLSATVRKALDT